MTTPRVLPYLLGGALLGVGACGSAGDGDAAAGDRAPVADDDRAALDFAACMRKQGIEVSDPDGSGRVRMEIRARPGQEFSPRKVRDATRTCREQTGGGPREPTDAEKTELRDQALKFAKCMRAHGVDMPDPGAGGGIMLRRGGALDPSSSAFKRAEAACHDLMPTLPGTGDAAPAAGGGPSAPTGVPAP